MVAHRASSLRGRSSKQKAQLTSWAAMPTIRVPIGPSLAELCHAVSEPRDLAAGGVLVHDAFLRRAHDDRLGFLQCGGGPIAVSGRDRVLDLADIAAQP